MMTSTLKVPHPSDYGLSHGSWREDQFRSVQWALRNEGVGMLEAPTGCHPAGQEVLMYSGLLKQVQDVRVGDLLMGPDSKPRKVMDLIGGNDWLYTVTPKTAHSFQVNADHILTLVRTPDKTLKANQVIDVPLREWFSWGKTGKHIHKLFSVPVDFPSWGEELPISPYFLGILLGDGSLGSGVAVTSCDESVIQETYRQATLFNLQVRVDKITYYLTAGPGGKHDRNALINTLKDLGLYGSFSSNKRAPMRYKVASRQDRFELLAGLLDADGHLSRCSVFDFVSKSFRLAADVTFLARSLGFRARMKTTEKYSQYGGGGTYYRVFISGDVGKIPCRLERKQAPPRKQKKDPLRTGFSVEPARKDDYFGFVLDGDGRYLLDSFIVTHNSGKTAICAAVSSRRKVFALCRTRALQTVNYDDYYDFDALFGKDNYDCELSEGKAILATCAECAYAEEGMSHCPSYGWCPYPEQRERVLTSQRGSLNYAYWLVTYPWLKQVPPYMPETLFLDEAHELSDVVLDHMSVTFAEEERRKWDLPHFPLIAPISEERQAMMGITVRPHQDALDWLAKCVGIVRGHYLDITRLPTTKERNAERRKAELLGKKLAGVMMGLERTPHDWFIRSGPKAREFRGKRVPGFLCLPLTARHHFPHYFISDAFDTIMMSATIGNPLALATELGIGEDFSYRRVKSKWPPETRPILVLDAPRMSRGGIEKDENAWSKQADVIAKAILRCPHDWSGIILVTRRAEAGKLMDRLARRGLQDRIYAMPGYDDVYVPTDRQVREWHERLKRVPNSICIGWSLWAGYDGLREKILIAAKAPFPNIGNRYEIERMEYDRDFYRWRTACTLAQGLGRTRRGRPQDYDSNDEMRGLVAIADASWRQIRKDLPKWTKEAIVE